MYIQCQNFLHPSKHNSTVNLKVSISWEKKNSDLTCLNSFLIMEKFNDNKWGWRPNIWPSWNLFTTTCI